mgnify:CR=1 FL=1
MELWIRSQDKETLMKVNRIDVQEQNIICYDNDYHCNETYMGEYKSKERALEVLDEIQDELISTSTVPIFNNEKITCGCARVYEMPKE